MDNNFPPHRTFRIAWSVNVKVDGVSKKVHREILRISDSREEVEDYARSMRIKRPTITDSGISPDIFFKPAAAEHPVSEPYI